MKKIILGLAMALALTVGTGKVEAQDYVIEDFKSQITVNKDRSLEVKETITAQFDVEKHGIIRVIPYAYSPKRETVITNLTVMGVEDGSGNKIPFKVENYKQSKRVRIGDPDKTIQGEMTYVLIYKVEDTVLDYEGNPEVYWNVTGSEWDTVINKAEAEVVSPWAEIVKSDCFGGDAGTTEKSCEIENGSDRIRVVSTSQLGAGKDLTVVAGFNPENQLIVPSEITRVRNRVENNWGYGLALVPLLIMMGMWWKKGRDQRYKSDGVYYKPENDSERTVSPFDRPHLPTVYSKIEGLTPAEVGAILDEQVNNSDLVAEIVELARLGYISIKKLEKKFLLWKDDDYLLSRLPKETSGLKEHQEYLLESIFKYADGKEIAKIKTAVLNSMKAGKVDKMAPKQQAAALKLAGALTGIDMGTEVNQEIPEASAITEEKVLISSLKNKFYVHVGPFKKKVFQSLVDQEAIKEDPRTTQLKWLGAAAVIGVVVFWLLFNNMEMTGNEGPLLVLIFSIPVVLILVGLMPRKTAWGYSLHRQAAGLKYYINVGKWRQEIAEKNLFLEEILPLAIAVGVVKKLTADMSELQMEPPKYFEGSSLNSFSSDFVRFAAVSSASATSAPSSSGSGSWSGGSGFSGGSSGGGMGGGGGSSW